MYKHHEESLQIMTEYYREQEGVNLNADEDMATVYSANPAWIRKMDALVRVS